LSLLRANGEWRKKNGEKKNNRNFVVLLRANGEWQKKNNRNFIVFFKGEWRIAKKKKVLVHGSRRKSMRQTHPGHLLSDKFCLGRKMHETFWSRQICHHPSILMLIRGTARFKGVLLG